MTRWRVWLIHLLGGFTPLDKRELTIKTIQCRSQKVYSSVTVVPDPFDQNKFDEFLKGAIARNLIDELTKCGFIRYTKKRTGNQETLTGCIYVVEQPDEEILTFDREA